MSQRGSSNIFKYPPLQLKGANQESSSSPKPGASSPNKFNFSFSPRVPMSPSSSKGTSPCVTSQPATEFEPSNSLNILSSSLSNITNWCQNQERRNSELQRNFNAATIEIECLNAKLRCSTEELEQLRCINHQLKDAHQHLEKNVQEVYQLYAEVKNTVASTAQTIAQIGEDRETWLVNFENLQKKHFDNETQNLLSSFDENIKRKELLIQTLHSDVERLLAELHDLENNRDGLKDQLSNIMLELNTLREDKEKSVDEKQMLKDELEYLKLTFDKLLHEQTSELMAKYKNEDAKNEAIAQELSELRKEWNVLEAEFQKNNSILAEMNRIDRSEPREIMRVEISTLRERVDHLNEINCKKEKELLAVSEKLASAQQSLIAFDEMKCTLENLSKEKTALQNERARLEMQCSEKNVSLLECINERNQLQLATAELKGKVEEDTNKKRDSEIKIRELEEKITSYQQKLDESEQKMKDFTLQLASVQDSNIQLQNLLDKKACELEKHMEEQKSAQQLKTKLNEEIDNFKCQLMTNAIEIQYKDKKIEEMEKTLNEMNLNSNNLLRGDTTHANAELQKITCELEKLKTSFNLKSLELENANDQLKEAKETISSTERKITDMEFTIHILESKLKSKCQLLAAAPDETFSTERTVKPTGKEDPNLEKSYSLFSASSADSSSTLTLLQKANAAAKVAELKRRKPGSSVHATTSDSLVSQNLTDKRRRINARDDSTLSTSNICHNDSLVHESPIIRNKSGVKTSRFLPRSHSSSDLASPSHCEIDEDIPGDDSA